jgi:hypothetical protein
MYAVKNKLPYKSDVKGNTKDWLHKCFQTTSTIYLNKKGIVMCNVGQLIWMTSWYAYNNTFDMVWDSVCYTCNTPML